MCLYRLLLCLALQHQRQRTGAGKRVQLVAAERPRIVAGQQPQTAIVVVSAGSAAGLPAAEACQGVPQLLGLHQLDADCGWACHMGLRVVEPGERGGVVLVRCLARGNVVAVNGLAGARIVAVLRPGEVDSAVVGAREERWEEVGRIDRLVEAQNIAVGLVVVGLSRVRFEVVVKVESAYHIHPSQAVLRPNQLLVPRLLSMRLTRIKVPAWGWGASVVSRHIFVASNHSRCVFKLRYALMLRIHRFSAKRQGREKDGRLKLRTNRRRQLTYNRQ